MISRKDLKEIPNFNGYYISKDGHVYSKRKTKELHEMVLKEDKDGYLEVGLYRNNKRYFRRVHRLVLETWSPDHPSEYNQVNHKDGNVKNNNISNLEWCSVSHNIKHSFRVLGRKPSITTNKKVELINNITKEKLIFNSIKDCANYLNMSYEHLDKLLVGTYDITKSRILKNYTINLL